ncbi:MAG: hypothetical protein P4L40_14405 [Terracidiphilus sp.]|nr:hypothetical protein [Terracidiphilus sp.]
MCVCVCVLACVCLFSSLSFDENEVVKPAYEVLHKVLPHSH